MEPILPIIVNTPEGKRKINPDEIMYLRAEGKRTEVNLKNSSSIIVNHNLRWFEDHLPEEYFIRIHRSFIINISQVSAFTANKVILSHKQKIPVGRCYRKGAKERLQSLQFIDDV